MKNWTSRFAVLMVAGAIMCSAMIVGCGGGDDEDTTNTTNTTTTTEPKDD
jgi:hypothetical protein